MMLNPGTKILDSKPLISFFAQTGVGTAFTYLTSGIFLSGLGIMMGAGDVLVSYLSVIANICGVLILVFAVWLERFGSRKRLAVTLTVLSRMATLFIVTIPAFIPERIQLGVFIVSVIVAFTLQAQTTVILNQWMFSFMDGSKSGRYISLRQTMTLVVTVILSLTGGYWMDAVQGRYEGFVVLFSAAALMGIIEILLLVRTPDSEPYKSVAGNCRICELILQPLKNCCFTGFVIYIFAFYLLLNVADSFTMVYMLRYLELPYQTVTALYLIISLPQVILLGIWGKISDRCGHQFVLKSSIWFFSGETFFMFLASPEHWHLFIPAAFLAASAANAGFAVAVFNRRYELMPEENRIVYDNFYTAAIGLGCTLGPMIGGVMKGCLEKTAVVSRMMPFAGIRMLYIVSTAGILLLQIIYLYMPVKRCYGKLIRHKFTIRNRNIRTSREHDKSDIF